MTNVSPDVLAGQSLAIRAADYNGLLEILRERVRGGFETPSALADESRRTFVLVENATDNAVGPGAVLSLTEPTITDDAYFRNEITLKGVTPNAGTDPFADRFCILIDGARSGSIARGIVGGVTVAYVNVTSDTDRWATLVSGDTSRLRTRPWPAGAQILWMQAPADRAEVGVALAVLRLGMHHGQARFIGKVGTATVVDANRRWTYTVDEVTLNGYTAPATLANGIQVAGVRNLSELATGAAAVSGEQIDLTNDAPDGGSITLRAIQAGTIVECWQDQAGAWWFDRANGATVACS